ncbi:RagB/SusD family nutrient uptake outer membrane protein [Galbibacter mesophilus]|uniref:RagB/SusD family nutrient uptake outer membrane protein n=1 Tax=Galbibacter mesophilus TaxID=379069 RepID=UPI0019201C4E|nr:RagB/SusD family nutrient uptake outer membrane protein [Galbibacter mesophilus]MCM5664043.1 RagB/SusD family nutrient uptake outer membrane protein [Galbibacter mesophilus]
MKKYTFLLGTIAFFSLLIGCEEMRLGDEFLSKPPGGDITIDTVYANIENAQDALTAAYNTLPYGLPTGWGIEDSQMNIDIQESLTDLTQSYLDWGGAVAAYYNGTYTAFLEQEGVLGQKRPKYKFIAERAWEGIRRSYSFINNIDQVPDANQATKDRLKGEAMMVVATHYCEMFRNYGGMPWINKTFSPSDDTSSPRLTAEATMDSIVALCDRAAKLLPWQVQDISNNEGRFSRAAAKALKIRVLLFGASPLFNSSAPYRAGEASDLKMTWFGGYDASIWRDVVTACEDFLNELAANGGYSLVNTGNPRTDFTTAYYERGSSELLISTRKRYRTHNLFFRLANEGAARPSQELVDMYPMVNGMPIDDPSSGYDPNNPYANRDPRLYETAIVNGDAYRGRTAELYLGGRERRDKNVKISATGYMQRKFYLDGDNATSRGSIVQWPYLRLPEVFLSYAEALNEVNGGPTAKAYEYLNKTRERVGVGGTPEGMSQKEFREEVLTERAREFAYEEIRWYDLVRWKIPFIQPHGTNIIGNKNQVTDRELFETTPRRYWIDNWDPKWYLSAFPPNEINKDYGLVQNPGW